MKRLFQANPLLKYGLLILLVIMWYIFLFQPMKNAIEENRFKAQRLENRLKRLRSTLKSVKNLDKRLANARKGLEQRKKKLIKGANHQLVTSNLQDMLLKKASDVGLEVVTYKTASKKKWRNYTLAVVNLTVKADTNKLVKYLKSLEDMQKAIRIGSINIVTVRGRNPYLRVRMDVEALYMEGVKSS